MATKFAQWWVETERIYYRGSFKYIHSAIIMRHNSSDVVQVCEFYL